MARRHKIKLILILFFILDNGTSFASSCCGGGASGSNLIMADNLAQASFSYVNQVDSLQVTDTGSAIALGEDTRQIQEFIHLSYAQLFLDFWQWNVSIPFQQNTNSTPNGRLSEQGVGDVAVGVAYEFLPELEYSVWKPRGWFSVTVVAPTGRSRYSAHLNYGLDTFGLGLWQNIYGFHFSKNLADWDFLAETSYNHRIQRKFNVGEQQNRVSLGEVIRMSLSLGWSPTKSASRIGAQFEHYYQGHSISYYEDEKIQSGVSRWTRFGINYSYRWTNMNVTLNYFDETLLGPTENKLLARGVSFSSQYFWPL